MTTAWRLARSLVTLRAEVNRRWPDRSKLSDGTLGDADHLTRVSSHNPDRAGVVRAFDATAAGIDADWYAEHLRRLGASGFVPLQGPGGLVIWNRRYANAKTGWAWTTYRGPNPHDRHIHTSCSDDPNRYDDTSPWEIDRRDPPDDKDDFMAALTHAEQHELLARVRSAEEKATSASLLAASTDQRCARLEASVHGVDQATKGESLLIKVRYLAAETIDGVKGPMLDRVLRKFGAE